MKKRTALFLVLVMLMACVGHAETLTAWACLACGAPNAADATQCWLCGHRPGTTPGPAVTLIPTPETDPIGTPMTFGQTWDPTAAQLIEMYAADGDSDELNSLLATLEAHTDHALTIVDEAGNRIIRCRETNLGDLVADAYRSATGADVALVGGGSIRTTIPAGKMTMDTVKRTHPFGNVVICVEATGRQILDALEWSSRRAPGENGGFLQVSGLTYEIHTGIPDGCLSDENGMFAGVAGRYRVNNVTVNNEPLDLERTYTVAGTAYMLLEGGDGVNVFMNDRVIPMADTVPDYLALISYILGPLDGHVGDEYAGPQGRIVIAE